MQDQQNYEYPYKDTKEYWDKDILFNSAMDTLNKRIGGTPYIVASFTQLPDRDIIRLNAAHLPEQHKQEVIIIANQIYGV